MSENGFRLEASDWEKSCFENGSCLPAEFSARHDQLGTARSRSCIGRFRAAQRVLGALLGRFVGTSGRQSVFQGLFFGTLGRHSAFWKLFFCTLGRHSAFWKRFFDSLPSKESFEPYKNPKFQGTKTEVISILKNARFTGSGAKS